MTESEKRNTISVTRNTTLPPWLSPRELADHLGLPIQTVYRWNTTGDGPAMAKIGRHVRYRREDVDAWLTARVRSAAA
ncbi:excisionase family DNA binding protein [Kineococcus radiotolerans]|uniref:Excisionase family DNA binding protein n=1 Tax=Kineococcus radiotolerans TaxID=131568 RepID=A0A7W4XWU5_KINRA|nr:helix-turn-helix domain-containing protein [Kineococcus radiotolerans]MBB2900495.1 excisionase family DNA binding protein [Kineococcus radiotolerans]